MRHDTSQRRNGHDHVVADPPAVGLGEKPSQRRTDHGSKRVGDAENRDDEAMVPAWENIEQDGLPEGQQRCAECALQGSPDDQGLQ